MNLVTETPRLLLREFEISDAEALLRLNSNEEVLRYTGDIAFETVQDARNFLENYNEYERNGFGRWAVVLKDSGSFIGWCGLKKNEEGYVDLGFRFFQEEWGKGYATEAAEASLSFGFKKLGLKEIIGRVAPENKASLRVLEKLGMTYWKSGNCHGIPDAMYYKITAPSFAEK
ncbi:MAG: GNAT family N-acetyltransferase [Flavobacteriales bacterium]|nr:GNAT family N-acetyltransferase [Flavobacteriales bacterium]